MEVYTSATNSAEAIDCVRNDEALRTESVDIQSVCVNRAMNTCATFCLSVLILVRGGEK